MIAIIPCAGKGPRRRPDTEHTPKILLEHQGQPLIELIIRPIDASGCFEKIVLVLSLKHGNKVIDYLRRHPLETPVRFVWQHEPLGFGHAVLQARDEGFSFYIRNPPVLLCTDDGVRHPVNPKLVNPASSSRCIGDLSGKNRINLIKDITANSTSTIGVQWRGNVKNYGMALVKDYAAPGHVPRPNIPKSGVSIERLVEKPYWDEGGLALTGIYFIRESRRLFRCLNKLVKTGRVLGGEYQLTHALQMMIDAGTPFRTYYHEWIDCGKTGRREDGRTGKRESENWSQLVVSMRC